MNPTLHVTFGYVVYNDDKSHVVATHHGAFVWDTKEDAAAHCRKGFNDRVCRVEICMAEEKQTRPLLADHKEKA